MLDDELYEFGAEPAEAILWPFKAELAPLSKTNLSTLEKADEHLNALSSACFELPSVRSSIP